MKLYTITFTDLTCGAPYSFTSTSILEIIDTLQGYTSQGFLTNDIDSVNINDSHAVYDMINSNKALTIDDNNTIAISSFYLNINNY
jgi:uncharacterized protein YfkK (UPF0435 family)